MKIIRTILADIEGTTSSIDFVHDVLFPYAARELPRFLREHGDEPAVAELLGQVRAQAGEPQADAERLTQVLLDWIAEDRKATPLKALQGLIWERGYRDGDFTGHVYADTEPAFRRWRERGASIYLYSSGSVQAQELLFGHSDAGDLRPLIDGYFDTRVGGKRDPDCYRGIAERIGRPADAILFLSDVAEELDAAADAGMQTMQIARGARVTDDRHPVAADFDEVTI